MLFKDGFLSDSNKSINRIDDDVIGMTLFPWGGGSWVLTLIIEWHREILIE